MSGKQATQENRPLVSPSPGVGMVYDNQLVFAWGDLGIDYHLVIYTIEDELLKGNCVLEKSQFISKEQFVRKSK